MSEFRGFRAWDGKQMLYDVIPTCEDENVVLDDYDWHATPCVVEQYTGLKDRNGKEIYEGDIIRDTDDDIAVIEWGLEENHKTKLGYYAKWREPRYGKWIMETTDSEHFEVIGNIHQNKELLYD